MIWQVYWFTHLCHVLPCSVILFFCCLGFSVFSLHRRSMTQHTGEAKDEEHRKKLEDLIQQVPDKFDFAFGTSLGLSCCTSMPSCDFIYLATSAVSKRWKMQCCHEKLCPLASVWSSLALYVSSTGGRAAVTSWSWSTAGAGFIRSVVPVSWPSPTRAHDIL
jgi:hypothetical protein